MSLDSVHGENGKKYESVGACFRKDEIISKPRTARLSGVIGSPLKSLNAFCIFCSVGHVRIFLSRVNALFAIIRNALASFLIDTQSLGTYCRSTYNH